MPTWHAPRGMKPGAGCVVRGPGGGEEQGDHEYPSGQVMKPYGSATAKSLLEAAFLPFPVGSLPGASWSATLHVPKWAKVTLVDTQERTRGQFSLPRRAKSFQPGWGPGSRDRLRPAPRVTVRADLGPAPPPRPCSAHRRVAMGWSGWSAKEEPAAGTAPRTGARPAARRPPAHPAPPCTPRWVPTRPAARPGGSRCEHLPRRPGRVPLAGRRQAERPRAGDSPGEACGENRGLVSGDWTLRPVPSRCRTGNRGRELEMTSLDPLWLGRACCPQTPRRCCAGLTGQPSPRPGRLAELRSPNSEKGVRASAGRPRRARGGQIGKSLPRCRQMGDPHQVVRGK